MVRLNRALLPASFLESVRTLLFLVLAVVTLGQARADNTPPAGIIVLKAVAGYDAAATLFTSIQWTSRDGGFVVDGAGTKTPFLNDAIGRVIYFDPVYHDEVDHNSYWVEWRIIMRNREVVLGPIDAINLRPEDSPRLTAEQAILEDTMERYSNSRPVIEPLIAELSDQCAKLASGQVLQNGQWLSAKDAGASKSEVPIVGDSESMVTFTTKDGKRFENAKVSVTETGLSVLTSDGGASVAFDRLPDDLSMFPKTIRDKIVDANRRLEIGAAASAPAPGVWDTITGFFSSISSWFGSGSPTTSSPAPAPTNSPPAAVASPPPPQPPAMPQPATSVASMLVGSLVSASGNAVPTPGPDIRYYAIYYSAQWCPPCQAFTPKLVKWYHAFKPAHPNFELIFVSEDHNESAMLDYMKEMNMPWPAVRFGALRHDGSFKGSGIEQYAGDGIPDLVLVDSGGTVLADSFQGGSYVGPGATIGAINQRVGGGSPVPIDP